MCGCEFNLAAAGGAIAGSALGHFYSRSDISAIYNSAMVGDAVVHLHKITTNNF